MISKYLLITILRIHPTLPLHIPYENMEDFLSYINDPWFRTRLPCETISAMSEDVGFIKSIPGNILETIVTSKRMLSCVPVRNMEMLLSHKVGLSRVSLLGLLTSFSKIPSDKLSLKLIRLLLMNQVNFRKISPVLYESSHLGPRNC